MKLRYTLVGDVEIDEEAYVGYEKGMPIVDSERELLKQHATDVYELIDNWVEVEFTVEEVTE